MKSYCMECESKYSDEARERMREVARWECVCAEAYEAKKEADGPYRQADKPEQSVEEAWAAMWCTQRHTEDLKEIVKGNLFGLFKDDPSLRYCLPAIAQEELDRREEQE